MLSHIIWPKVITFDVAQSDHIKRFLVFNNNSNYNTKNNINNNCDSEKRLVFFQNFNRKKSEKALKASSSPESIFAKFCEKNIHLKTHQFEGIP